jgi:glycerate kinase
VATADDGGGAAPGTAIPPLRVLAAPNAFKGALPAGRAAEAMAQGALDGGAQEVLPLPMADGGDGTADVLCQVLGGQRVSCMVEDAWGRRRRAWFARLTDGSAVLDLAAAVGLGRARPTAARALTASTFGLGQLVRAAVAQGAGTVRLALGGSATSDGGAGMLIALGARVWDTGGQPLERGGGALTAVSGVDLSGLGWLKGVRLEALVDVRNPLLGDRGAAAVFAPQKGAGPAEVRQLEAGLRRWADLLEAASGRGARDLAGAGAAGGTGFALAAACGATLLPGAEFVLDAVGLRRHLRPDDLVLTGEGVLDGQTAEGKAPAAVAAAAAAAGAPCCALAGCLGPGWQRLLGDGLTAAFPLAPAPRPRAQALANTAEDLRRTAAMVTRLVVAARARRGG